MKHLPLAKSFSGQFIEAGCDEAGRGCLAGPVFAAAVILPPGFPDNEIDDSKRLSARVRYRLRDLILTRATAWAVARIDAPVIDEINILNASIQAMHRAIDQLETTPQLLLIDGNRFHPYPLIPHQCLVGGDARFLSIAAASILAKTYRDDFMIRIHEEFPQYGWNRNKGYPSPEHRCAIDRYGLTPYHRKSFRHTVQLKFPFFTTFGPNFGENR